jgi:hypothetical protein
MGWYLLQRIKGEPRQFRLDEIWAVLHDGLETDVLLLRLPRGHQMEHVLAVHLLPLVLARLARKFDTEGRKHGFESGGILHFDEASVEVDL